MSCSNLQLSQTYLYSDVLWVSRKLKIIFTSNFETLLTAKSRPQIIVGFFVGWGKDLQLCFGGKFTKAHCYSSKIKSMGARISSSVALKLTLKKRKFTSFH